ncbi:hypothetical protein GCM10010478_26110 [Streptomyces erythrogriseus]|uniref:Uncharacterized protein n=1 Tax=Streptomyces erythrogriseus TaxID=284027 RepID=A0ABN3WSW7_9ACTN
MLSDEFARTPYGLRVLSSGQTFTLATHHVDYDKSSVDGCRNSEAVVFPIMSVEFPLFRHGSSVAEGGLGRSVRRGGRKAAAGGLGNALAGGTRGGGPNPGGRAPGRSRAGFGGAETVLEGG